MKGLQRSASGIYNFLGHHQINVLRSTRSFLVNNSLIVPQTGFGRSQKFRNLYSSNSSFASVSKTQTTLLDAESPGSESVASSIDTKIDSFSKSDNVYYKSFTDIESLLNASQSETNSLSYSCHLLFNLGEIVRSGSSRSDIEKIQADPRFIKFSKNLSTCNFQAQTASLLNALQGVYNLGLAEDDNLRAVLENDLKWVMRRCPIKYVARAIEILSSQTNSDDQWMLKLQSTHPLIIAVEALHRRWVEVATGLEFLSAFKVLSALKNETRLKLEDRAVELVQEFTPMEMIKMFITLGSQKRRPTPLLRALAFHLSKSGDKIQTRDLVDLVYALNELTFAEPVLMSKICNDLEPEIPKITHVPLISSLATSLGQMRYKHQGLLQALDDWIMAHFEHLRPFDCASWLLASAVFNLQSESTIPFCNKAKQLLLLKETNMNPTSLINIVHALVVLNQADYSFIASSILEPNFVAKIDSEEKNFIQKSKLLQINAATKSVKDYKGPYLSTEIVAKWTPAVVKSNDIKFSQVVNETLGNFLPPPKYLTQNKSLSSGVFVDAVCMLSDRLVPVPIETKEGNNKIAIVVQSFSSFCTGLKEPTGQSCLAVRLVRQAGYHVITVPYTEFSVQEKLIRRVQYLEQRIKNLNLKVDDGAISPSQ